jgi:hypothetical protein
MDLFDELPESDQDAPPAVVSGQLVERVQRRLTRAEKAESALEAIADSLYEDALGVIDDAMQFADVEPAELEPGEAPPSKWVEQVGYEKAARRQRVARTAWMPKKDAPVGLSIALTMASSITAARAKSKEGPSTLNVTYVQITGPEPTYEVVDVER